MTETLVFPSPALTEHRVSRVEIDVDEAPALVARVVAPLAGAETVPLREAAGRVLYTAVHSPIAVPPFDHSALDGYALRSEDIPRPNTTLSVVDRVLAGEQAGELSKGAAIRVMTGAPIPVGCDAVVKQENVERFDGRIVLSDTIRLGSNIRRMGEDVGAGDPLAGEGTILDTRHVALLAACGVDKVQSVRRVRIAIAAFGNEIREPGVDLRRGQIFDTNSAMAAAFLQRPYTQLQQCVRSGDNRDRAVELLRDLSADADLIVTSGGMASGDEDHTRRALEEAGGSWQRIALRMRPGKPAGLGRLGNAVLLGLPGNPFAALVALLILGVPILDALTGSRRTMRWSTAAYSTEFPESPAARTEFFPARIIAQSHSGSPIIERLGKGGSARLRPLVDADGLGRSNGGVSDRLRSRSVEFLSFAELLAH